MRGEGLTRAVRRYGGSDSPADHAAGPHRVAAVQGGQCHQRGRGIGGHTRRLLFGGDRLAKPGDGDRERLIEGQQQALGEALAGRTSIVIAHRLSTVRAADLILVVEDGRIVERGTHPDLLARGGRYAELYETQFGSQREAVAA